MSLDPLLDELAILPEGWQDSPVGRREAARDSPLLWAYLYLRHHLRSDETGGVVSFSQVHVDWADHAKGWMIPGRHRDVFVAPRAMGKSTWLLLALPLWAAAYGYVRFGVALSDSATQAELHLSTMKRELETNTVLRQDYPDLCTPARRPRGTAVADNRGMLHTKSGFVFAARGIDAGTLGMKVGEHRPDLIIADDVEPGASNYSAYQVERRLATLTDVILPLNDQARVVVIGTTTLTGSIIHQAVTHHLHPDESKWIDEEGFAVHHALPFDSHGESVWPERWPTAYLRSIQGQRGFQLNFMNAPVPVDGEYWQPEDYVYGRLGSVSRRIVAVDPAVTTNRSSDETGVCVISYSAVERRACVEEAFGVRLKGEPLRQRVLDLIRHYPDVVEVYVERNQGGEMMVESVFHDMPVPVNTMHNSVRKEVRIEQLLSYYRRAVILHARRFPTLETQGLEFPKGLHDDVLDVVALGVARLAGGGPARTTLKHAVR